MSAAAPTVARGGFALLLVSGSPQTALTVTVVTTATAPPTITVDTGASGGVGQAISTTAQATGYSFTVITGRQGQVSVVVPLPQGMPLGPVAVRVVGAGTCAGAPTPRPATVLTITAGPGATDHGQLHARVFFSPGRVFIRTPELPPNADAVAHVRVRVITDPGARVVLTTTVVGSVGSLGVADDGGVAYSSGATFYSASQTADVKGSAHIAVPVSSTLLIPGRGARVVLAVRASVGGATVLSRTSFPIREIGLRLVIQPQESTRGNKRPVCKIAGLIGGSSHIRVGVLAVKGAHVTGVLTFGPVSIPASGQPLLAGSGSRVSLLFVVPNSVGGQASGRLSGTVTVTTTFRGATVTRASNLTCGVPGAPGPTTTPRPTAPPAHTATPGPTLSATSTSTPRPTATPTALPTATLVPTPSVTGTAMATVTTLTPTLPTVTATPAVSPLAATATLTTTTTPEGSATAGATPTLSVATAYPGSVTATAPPGTVTLTPQAALTTAAGPTLTTTPAVGSATVGPLPSSTPAPPVADTPTGLPAAHTATPTVPQTGAPTMAATPLIVPSTTSSSLPTGGPATATVTPSATSTGTPAPSATPTQTSSATSTQPPTQIPSITATEPPSATAPTTVTATPTAPNTATATTSLQDTATAAPSPSVTPSLPSAGPKAPPGPAGLPTATPTATAKPAIGAGGRSPTGGPVGGGGFSPAGSRSGGAPTTRRLPAPAISQPGRPRSVLPDARGQATPRSGPSPVVPARLPNTGQRPDAMTPMLFGANYPGGHAPLPAAWPARAALCLLTLLGVMMRPRRRAPREPM